MFKIVTILALWAAIAGCMTTNPTQPRGFAGYAFHSGYSAIKDDMERSGYGLVDEDEVSIWYDGTLYGLPVQLSYEFDEYELVGGYIDVLELSEASWHSVGKYLADKYPLSTKEPCQNTDKLCRIICTGDAKIVHLLSDDREVHVVRYFERTPRHRCGRDQGPVEEASANSIQ